MSSEVNGSARITEVEQTIRRLRDVVAARIVADALGQIEEVHVLVDSSRNPKLVSRDVESALMSELGLRIDHRKISVAQIRDQSAPVFASDRLKLLNLSFSVDRRRAEARVTLGRSDEVYTGVASAPASERDRLRLAAEAATDAISSYALALATGREEEPRLALQEVREIDSMGSSRAVVAVVRLTNSMHQENLLGSALIAEDPSWAAACAALDAVNRRLSSLAEA
jgi:hypothetical protein